MPFSQNGLSSPPAGRMMLTILSFVSLFFCPTAFSQASLGFADDEIALDSLRSIYLSRIAESSPLYNGVQYIRDGRAATGFPFYGSDSMQNGSVTLIGFSHPGLHLYYDLVSDDLVTETFNRSGLFRIPKSAVSSFRLEQNKFVHLKPDTVKGQAIKEGYYEFIPCGSLDLLIRWEKTLETRPGYEQAAYKTYSYYFIRRGNQYLPVDGKPALLRILADQEDAIRRFIRSEDLNFKNDPKSAYTKTLQFYGGLKH